MSVKIAIVINTSWNVYNFRKGLVLKFLEEGHEVIVVAPEDAYSERIKAWGVKHVHIDLESSGLNPTKDLTYFRRLKQIFKSEKPDIILGFTIKSNIYGAMAARSFKIPIVCNVSGLGTTFLWKGWVRRVAISLYNRAFKGVDFTFFQNTDDRKLFLEFVKIDSSKTGLLPGSGIDLQLFNSKPPEFQGPTKFLMISRLIIEKGVLDYLHAAETVKKERSDVEFQLLGSYESDHKRSISEENFNRIKSGEVVDYLGQSDNVKKIINEADVVVLPSYREGTPRTLLEAAALSRPLIATNVPGCKEVVSDGVSGFLCEPKNAESLSSKMKLFLSLSNEEKKTMSEASRNLVEKRFDEGIVISEYSRKIKQLLN